jgi:hypothetical protein
MSDRQRGEYHPGDIPDGVQPGQMLYGVLVYGQPGDHGEEVVISVLGGPGPLWDRVPEPDQPKVARIVADHVVDFIEHLRSTADLVDDVDTVDVADIIEQHNRTRNEDT